MRSLSSKVAERIVYKCKSVNKRQQDETSEEKYAKDEAHEAEKAYWIY